MSLPEAPQSRGEQYLSKIAGVDKGIPEVPQSRVEQYLEYIANNGVGPSEEEIAEAVTEWMADNIHEDPTVVIDKSLAVEGAAADSKSVGDEINDLKADLIQHTSQIYSIGTELSGEIETANLRYYGLWQAPKQGSVLTFKNVGAINGILGATKQDGTFQNLIIFNTSTKEGTYTFEEQFKSIGFYGYQAGTAKILVTGANFDRINESILNNV